MAEFVYATITCNNDTRMIALSECCLSKHKPHYERSRVLPYYENKVQ